MSQTPTPEEVAQALVGKFALGKPADMELSVHAWWVREIQNALTEQARATWEAAARTIRELAHFNPTLETMAQEFDLRAHGAPQEGTKE